MFRRCSLDCLLGCCGCRSSSEESIELGPGPGPGSPPLPHTPAPPPSHTPTPPLHTPILPPPSPNTPNPPPKKYLRPWESFEADGKQLRLWISNASSQPLCPINRSTLTLADLVSRYGEPVERQESMPVDDVQGQLRELGYSDHLTPDEDSNCRFIVFNKGTFMWAGYIAPGMISMTLIHRVGKNLHPPISEVSQAIYRRYFDIDTLRHVFVWEVANVDTLGFLRERLYSIHHELDWPNLNRINWAYGTAEYDALLGTRLGKTASYLVLGAWLRGTRRISQIVTCADTSGSAILRFDIETV